MGQMGKSIGRGEAIHAVLSGLQEDPHDPLVVVEGAIREWPFGCVISFTLKRYLETRNPTYLPFGNLTWVVDRHDSAVHRAGPTQFIDMLEPGFLNRFLDAYQFECSIRLLELEVQESVDRVAAKARSDSEVANPDQLTQP